MTMPNRRPSKSSIKPMAIADREAAWAKHTAALSGGRVSKASGLGPASAPSWTAHATEVRRQAELRKGR